MSEAQEVLDDLMGYLEGGELTINSLNPISKYIEQVINLEPGARVGP